MEEPILEEPGVAQPRGEDAPPGGNNAPSPPPLLFEVMDHQTHLMETLAEGLLCPNGGPHNDFYRKLEGFLKLRPPTFDNSDDDPIATKDWLREMEKKLDLTTCSNEECWSHSPLAH